MPGSSAITVRPLTAADDALWERGLEESEQRSFLHWLPWLRCVGNHLGGHTVLGLERAGRLLGGLAGLVEESADGRRLRTIFLTAYHGLWVADRGLRPMARESLMDDVAGALIPHLNARWDRWAFSSAPELRDTRPFSDMGCTVDVQFTYRIDLADAETMLERFDTNARRRIRRAEKDGVTVEVCAPTEEDLRTFEDHMRSVGERQGVTDEDFPAGLFVEIGRLVHGAGCGQLFVARSREGLPAASLLATWDTHRAYTFLGAGIPELTKTGATRALTWTAFQWLHAREHREIDLLGANYQSLRTHKREWNPRLVPYFTVTGGKMPRMTRREHLKAAAKHLVKSLLPR
jgi:hypothetical protein